jgi:hypothetical protein
MAAILSAHEAVALSDPDLDAYLEQNRHPDGVIYVQVQDPTNLTAEFIRRLKCATPPKSAHRLTVCRDRAENPVNSRPADLQAVSARLCDLPAEIEFAPRTPTESTISEPLVTEEEQYNQSLEFATKAYHDLISDGGRPLFPLDLLEDASKNVDKYRETFPLAAWRASHFNPPGEDWMVFSSQLNRWNDFRRLQRYAREQRAASLSQFFFAAASPKTSWEALVAEGSRKGEKPATWKDYNEAYLKPGKVGFPQYRKMVRARLARHKFTRPYHLDKDPSRQDQLTTWVEYLNYEYWWHDRAADFVEHHRPSYNRYCKELLESGTLQQQELENITQGNTLEKLEDTMRHHREEVAAENAVHLARLAVERALRGRSTNEGGLAQAQRRLDAAIVKQRAVANRNNQISGFIQKTSEYWIASRDAERRRVLVEWVLQQASLIEFKLGSGATGNSPNETRARKRGIDDTERMVTPPSSQQDHAEHTPQDNRPRKRTRFDSNNPLLYNLTPSTSVHTSPSIGGPAGQPVERKRKREIEDDDQEAKAPKLRRSARIAERNGRCASDAPFNGAKSAAAR